MSALGSDRPSLGDRGRLGGDSCASLVPIMFVIPVTRSLLARRVWPNYLTVSSYRNHHVITHVLVLESAPRASSTRRTRDGRTDGMGMGCEARHDTGMGVRVA